MDASDFNTAAESSNTPWLSASRPSSSSNFNSATAILDKYNRLYRAIDDTRNETNRVQRQTDDISQEIVKLHTERTSLEEATVVADQESVQLQEQVDQVMEECRQRQREHSQSIMNKQRVLHDLARVKELMEEERQSFLTQSNNFRTWCQRMSRKEEEASALKSTVTTKTTTTTTSSAAWLEKQDLDFVTMYCYVRQFHEFDLLKDDGDVDDYIGDEANNKELENDPNNANVEAWMTQDDDDDDDDVELQQAKALYQSRKQSLETTQRRLDDIKTRYQVKQEEDNKQLKRKQQLQLQLERIQKDCASLQSQISEAQNATVEAEELSQGFQRDILRRTQHKQQQLQPPMIPHQTSSQATASIPNSMAPSSLQYQRQTLLNPYTLNSSASKKKKKSTTPSRKRLRRDGVSSTNTPNMSSSSGKATPSTATTTAKLQHPHRAGRIRVDRQFCMNGLAVIGGESLTDQGGGRNNPPPYDASQQHHNNMYSNPPSSPPPSTTATNASLPSEAYKVYDDDDDDDEIFSYVAFTKKAT